MATTKRPPAKSPSRSSNRNPQPTRSRAPERSQPARAAQPSRGNQSPRNGNGRAPERTENRFTITGTLYDIMDAIDVSATFTKREFVLDITDNPQYPQLAMFQASGRVVDDLNDYENGDEVTVHFNLRGREWKNPQGEIVYFNTLAAWRVETPRKPRDQARGSGRGRASAGDDEQPDDDIPF